jgi:hypothetical protein
MGRTYRSSSLVTALCLLPFACGEDDSGGAGFGPGDTGSDGTGGDDGGQTSSGGTSGGSDDGGTGTGGGGTDTGTGSSGTGSSGTGSSGTGTGTGSSGTGTGTGSSGTGTGTGSSGTGTGTGSSGTGTGTGSSGTGSSGTGTTTGTSSGGTTTGGTTTGTADTGTTTGGLDCSCVPDLDDGIFVVGENSEMYKYFPETNTFSPLGTFSCPGTTSSFSMAVDRKGVAWVMFRSTSDIFHIDLTQGGPLQCVDPGYSPNQMGGGPNAPYGYYGMAFVSNSEVDPCEKLYGNTFDDAPTGFSEGPLGEGDFLVLDPQTLLVSYIGETTFNGAELTGTGDGRAFMFGGVSPAKLVEVDKSDGTYIDVLPLGTLELTNAFAFAFFEGDFYFFTESGMAGSDSKVTHLDYDDTMALTDQPGTAPIRIVGAGVSTCVAPSPQ